MREVEESILKSTKEILGIPVDHAEFDLSVITHINSVFADLTGQLGIGPEGGYEIKETGEEVWSDFLADDKELNSVKSYIYLRVRLLWDPPTTSYLLASTNEQIEALELRLSIHREGTAWVDPDPPPPPTQEDIFL